MAGFDTYKDAFPHAKLASTTSALGSMVTTTSAMATASLGVLLAVAPCWVNAASGVAVRFQTSTRKPRSSSLWAMAEPMVPAPSSAIAGRGKELEVVSVMVLKIGAGDSAHRVIRRSASGRRRMPAG